MIRIKKLLNRKTTATLTPGVSSKPVGMLSEVAERIDRAGAKSTVSKKSNQSPVWPSPNKPTLKEEEFTPRKTSR